MAFWSNWFSASETAHSAKPVKSMEYKGYTIEAAPYRDGGQFQLAGTIRKDGKEHRFIRADKFTDLHECADFALSKGQLIIDQMGDRMFT